MEEKEITCGKMIYKGKRLVFLLEFIMSKMEKINSSRIAKILGMATNSVIHMLKTDNMWLSQYMQIFEYYDTKIVFSLEDPKGLYKNKRALNVKINPDGYLKDKRLGFFQAAMLQYGINKTQISQKLNISMATIKKRFDMDDVQMSFLFEFAEKFGLELNITIK